MDLAWRQCPRCTGVTETGEGRGIAERTVVLNPNPVPQAAPARQPAAPPGVLARLHVEEGTLAGRDFDFRAGRYKLGKAPREEPGASVVPLEDPYMSRDHASVTAGTAALILNDLMSTNGTFLNGERVQRAFLKEGDAVRMGRTTLRVTLAPRS